jgi:uncharacterized protein (DUF2249 family)
MSPDQAAPSSKATTPSPTDSQPVEVDVRTLPHAKRHEIIFAGLQHLAAGKALIIVNDHDPKPLRYQTEALWPGQFSWSYLEAGPVVWRVAITRVG